jgi:uncharacterized RDD family membrane protein YckC
MEKTLCNQCGREATPGTTFCVQCGARIGAAATTTTAMGAAAAPAMAPLTAATGSAVYPSAPVQYGGFWIRFVAAIIDAVVVSVITMPVSILVAGAMGAASALGSQSAAVGASIIGLLVSMACSIGGNWLYEAFMESSSKQATLGKMVFGMKVTDLTGRRISFARATGRHFAKYVSAFTLTIGYIMAGFTEKKQALHDMIAGTLVRR